MRTSVSRAQFPTCNVESRGISFRFRRDRVAEFPRKNERERTPTNAIIAVPTRVHRFLIESTLQWEIRRLLAINPVRNAPFETNSKKTYERAEKILFFMQRTYERLWKEEVDESSGNWNILVLEPLSI